MMMTDALLGARRFGWIAATLVFALGLIAHPGTGLTHSRPDSHQDDVGGQADGDDAELDGTLEILHEDREDGSGVYRHFLWTHDGKRLSLDGVQHPDLLTGDLVRVRGARSGQKFKLQMNTAEGVGSGQTPQLQTTTAAALQVLQYAPLPNTFGPQKTVVLLVNFTNAQLPSPYLSSPAWVKRQFDESSLFFQEVSYQQTSLMTDVFGPFTLPIAYTQYACPTSQIRDYGAAAAAAAGIDLSAYTHRVYLFAGNDCGFGGAATVGGNPSTAWLNGTAQVDIINHELGHNLGLYHSHSISCPPAVLGPNCTTQEYGDANDTMGSAVGHYNAFHKQRLGWLGYDVSPPITVVQSSGTYTIDAYECPGTIPKALKIQRGATAQAFFVELRRNVGADTRIWSWSGVYVHLATDGAPNSSYLLDMTPATPAYGDERLDVGNSFTDSVSGITIRTLSVSDTDATIQVDMGGTSPCVRSAPRVTASSGQGAAVQSGTMVTYNISVTNTDSAACAAASFTLQATTPTTSWQKSFGASSVTAGPGATVSTTLQITSPTVPTGAYTIVSAATSTTASPLSGSASVLYNVAPPCTRSAPSVTGSPAESPAVQAGTMVTYNVSVTNNDSAGCSASSFTLQATAPTTSWQKSFGASSVTTNPGATRSTTLRVTSPTVPTGAYTIVSAATRTTASPLSGSGSVLYNVAQDGPPPPPGDVTLTITTQSPIGREMTFGGTLTGSTSLSATIDSIAVAARYIVVDQTRKTWTIKVSGLFQGPHTFTVASGTLAVSKSFTVLK